MRRSSTPTPSRRRRSTTPVPGVRHRRAPLGRLSIVLGALVATLGSVAAQQTGAQAAAGAIAGAVFNDLNADGVRNTSSAGQVDSGIAGITMTAYGRDGAPCGTATTAADGSYSLSTSCIGAQIRVEATWDATDSRWLGLQPAPHGAGSGTTVQFVAPGATAVEVGLLRPQDFCGNNPGLAASCFFNGKANNDIATKKSIASFSWSATGIPAIEADHLASRQDTGATWGLAVSRSTKDVYSAAVLRRHIGLGPGGLTAIYKTTTAGVTTQFKQLPTASFGTYDDTTRGLGNAGVPSFDDDVFTKVAKLGIGDIEINATENVLYVTNLTAREIVSTPLDSSAATTSFGLPNLTCAGTVRPWGLNARSFTANGRAMDRVYAGVVCDGPTTADLGGAIYSLDVDALAQTAAGTWTKVLDVPDYLSGGYWTSATSAWLPWNDTWSPKQMIISGIDIDVDGTMTIGIMDRLGLQKDGGNYNDPSALPRVLVTEAPTSGDILKACPDANGVYALESNGACGGLATAGANTAGPGGGEFYFGDTWNNGAPVTLASGHPEIAEGAVVALPGSGKVASTGFDVNAWYTGGVRWFDKTTGAEDRNYLVFNTNQPPSAEPGSLGKASGLGDLELLCDAAPFEIGNRVWIDADRNGVQDPGEDPVPGVTVELYGPAGGAPLATATTAADGTYYFRSDVVTGLVPNTAGYELRIPADSPALIGYVRTQADASSSTAGADRRDSDGQPLGTTTNGATLTIATGPPGSTNHTYDFGFAPAPATEPTQTAPAAFGNPPSELPATGAGRIVRIELHLASTLVGLGLILAFAASRRRAIR